ncbi:hypothetical protein LEM8419_02338 [Neolewinella maritima]|uniref:Metal-dependent hydrolase n=1 Tax=Neolewinella maritima TaxID=1383882 RepID=A0ABM9B3D6_9BACT|nr:metal-dependent hydrolase [Neolewinella maritima]CAH1001435.1 hypothetical protein LEM8419_02338 [Neolewinella maritima]
MDSLTQIVLGAAVGEAVLGRKVGNRAMLWGGIAGTLPDLDVLSGLVADPMSALAYHRAFTHSLPFAVLAAPLIGLAVHRIYGGKLLAVSDRAFYPLAILAFWLLLLTGSYLMPLPIYSIPAITAVITLVFASICTVVAVFARRKAHGRRRIHQNATGAEWTILFFLAIATHPLLDCFTAYGTQLFEPISRVRLAWNTISVVDPTYTLPFLLLLVLAARSGRGTPVRRMLNTAGLVISSAYLLLTVVNHFNVRSVLDDTLDRAGLTADRQIIGPSLGSNLLWSGTAQIDSETYYMGQYSLLDQERVFSPLVEVAGRHALLAPYTGDRDLEILEWFTGGFYVVIPRDSGYVQLSDLRYGLLGTDPTDPSAYLFSWKIDTSVRPVRVVEQASGPQGDRGDLLAGMWERMWGI